jgi:hypothetical protein
MKNKVFFLLFISLMIFNQAKAMDEKRESDHFQQIPKVLILEIGSYLYDNDFVNFSLSNKRINGYLKNHKDFYMPHDKKEAIKILQETSFERLKLLTLKWSRRRKTDVLKFLKQSSQKFSDHTYSITMSTSDYERKMFNFEMDIKIKIFSSLLGEKDSKEDLIKLKQSKIADYYTTSPLLDNSPEAIRLKLIQGALIHEKILKDIQENEIDERFQKIKSEIIKKEKHFKPVTNFFKHIRAPIEDQI